MNDKLLFSPEDKNLLGELRLLIHTTRIRVATAVNSELTQLYWNIGLRIRSDVLGNERADYGSQIVEIISKQLTEEFGRGFEAKNLRRMVQFAEYFPDANIVATLWRQLSWSHFRELLPLKTQQHRDFYADMCRIETWSVRTLQKKIGEMLFERTALSKKPAELIEIELKKLRESDKLSPDLVFKDPYFLEFLGLSGNYLEKDLESAILRELESFILELGGGFAFVDRQKRMIIDGLDFHLDLLFYHRRLRRLVAVELKLGKFKAAYKGQMELYLGWLDRYEGQPGEEAPLGLILCAEGSTEQIELLGMKNDTIHVAEYWTELPSREALQNRLHQAVTHARERIAANPYKYSAEA